MDGVIWGLRKIENALKLELNHRLRAKLRALDQSQLAVLVAVAVGYVSFVGADSILS